MTLGKRELGLATLCLSIWFLVLKLPFRWYEAYSDSLVIEAFKRLSSGTADGWLGLFYHGADHGIFKDDIYATQFGLQGLLFSLPFRLGIPYFSAYRVVPLAICAVGSAWMLVIIASSLTKSARQFKIFLVLSALTPWLFLFAASIYWVLPLMLLPMALTAKFYNPEDGRSLIKVALFVSLACLAKALCGYEFSSAVALSPVAIVVLKEAQSANWKFSTAFLRGSGFALAGILGVVLALGIHFSALSAFVGGSEPAKQIFVSKYQNRANGAVLATETKVMPKNGTSMQVLKYYFGGGFPVYDYLVPGLKERELGSKAPKLMRIYGLHNLGLLVAVIWALVTGRKKWPDFANRYGLAYGIAVLASLTWPIVAKQHMYIHFQLCYIVFYIPMHLVGFLILAARFSPSEPA